MQRVLRDQVDASIQQLFEVDRQGNGVEPRARRRHQKVYVTREGGLLSSHGAEDSHLVRAVPFRQTENLRSAGPDDLTDPEAMTVGWDS